MHVGILCNIDINNYHRDKPSQSVVVIQPQCGPFVEQWHRQQTHTRK